MPSSLLLEFIDIYPRLCELAGLPIPEVHEGKSLVSLLGNGSSNSKDAAFGQFPRRHVGREYMGYAMRTARLRYVEWLDQETGVFVSC